MNISRQYLGVSNDKKSVFRYRLENNDGTSITLMNLGANVTGITVPDRYGQLADVVLGFDTLDPYLRSHDCMGDTIGRFANRIRDGRFSINGQTVQLSCNAGQHHIHGGFKGIGSHVWDTEIIEGINESRIVFSTVSPDGEEGYPGTLNLCVSYTWSSTHVLSIHYHASTDKPTVCNLTNHSYFNLAGHDHGTVIDHLIQIRSAFILNTDENLIPTGEQLSVESTPFDFRTPALIGDRLQLRQVTPLMQHPNGFDHYYQLNDSSMHTPNVTIWHEKSGRKLEMYTNHPGFQFFTANGTNFKSGKGGMHYGNYSGFCLEAQDCPNSPNIDKQNCKSFLYPGEIYNRTTIYAFSTFE